jgi:hypothetical protein
MNWDAIIAVAEILGVIAVIASLVYLAAQVKQSTDLARAAMVHATSELWASYTQMLAADGELADIYLRGINSEPLSPVETLRLEFVIEFYMSLLEDANHQYSSGLYFDEDDDTDLIEYIAPTYRALFRCPVGRHWWATVAPNSTPPSLYAKMNKIMKNWDTEESA